jgi:hypothetical protein
MEVVREMRKTMFFIAVAVFLLSACDVTSVGRYQIAASPNGDTYRLDKTTGEVWLIKSNTAEKIQMVDFRLKVGQRYIGEDTYSFTYLGKGQTGDIKTLDSFWIDRSAIDAELKKRGVR